MTRRLERAPKGACTPMVTLYAGHCCVGFIFKRGTLGFEVFDAAQHSLGLFSNERAALDALSIPAQQVSPPDDPASQ
jgi:hypothetical protein